MVERLEQCAALPLTVVLGPAGAGKSTAVTSWLEQTSLAVAWLSLDPGDDEPMRFFAYLLAALRTVVPTLPGDPAALLQAPDPATPDELEALLADELVIPLAAHPAEQALVLVLDDFHAIRDARIHAAMAWLLDHCPASLRLIVISRSEPPLPLVRLRARGELGELDEVDLRFSLPEAERFYAEVMGISLERSELERLEARTEGWPAGAQLAALSLRARRTESAEAALPSGGDRLIADYLLSEVFETSSVQTREFLLVTALLERVCAPLAAAVVGDPDARERIAELEQANLFWIPLDTHGRWFRYHHLFGEFLRQRARERGEAWLSERHARAARWLAARDLRQEAFEHALRAGDSTLLVELFERWAAELVSANQTGVVRRWLEQVPAPLHGQDAVFPFMAGWCDLIVGELEAGVRKLDIADALLEAGRASPMTRFIMGHLMILMRLAALVRGGRYDDALALAERLIAEISQSAPSREQQLVLGSLHQHAGMVHLERGELARAIDRLDQAERLTRVDKALDVVVLAFLAQAQRRLGRLDEAERSIRRALAYAEETQTLHLSGGGLAKIELGWLAFVRGDARTALAEVEQGIERNRLLRDVAYLAYGTELLARAKAALDELDEAIEAVDEALVLFEGTDMRPAIVRMQALRAELQASTGPSGCSELAAVDDDRPSPAAMEDTDERWIPVELTGRELEVLELVATGLSNHDIARRLFVSVGTIKTHMHRILAKLDVPNRTRAVHRARRVGLLRA